MIELDEFFAKYGLTARLAFGTWQRSNPFIAVTIEDGHFCVLNNPAPRAPETRRFDLIDPDCLDSMDEYLSQLSSSTCG